MKYILYSLVLVASVQTSFAIDPWDPSVVWVSHDKKTTWSGILPKSYPNCISKKDADGNPVMVSKNTVRCKTNQNGHYLNAESGNQDIYVETTTVYKSDATEACRMIGGRLPTIMDFETIQTDPDYYSFTDKEHYFISSSLRTRNNLRISLGFNGTTGNNFVYSVDRLDDVKRIRCIKK